MALRPQPCMKEVACMAANGDEASILMWMIRGGSTVLKPSWFNQLLYSRGFRCRESGSRVSSAELRLQKTELEDDSESWGVAGPTVPVVQLRAQYDLERRGRGW